MKISKRQLRRIIKEEKTASFERNVRTSLVNMLVSEGLVPRYQALILKEARLHEDADMKALEDSIVNAAKKAGMIGKIGIKALSAFIKPIANQAAAVAKGAGKWGIQHIGGAIAGSGKFLGAAAGGLATGTKDLLGGIKDEKDLRKLAEKKPEEFKKIHAAYVEKFKKMGLPVSDAASAAAFIGVSETEDGREAVEAAAKKGGISLDDLNSQLNFFGQMVKHLDAANKAAAGGKSESRSPVMKITKRQLRRIIAEERRKLVVESDYDIDPLEDQISSAAFGVASVFSEIMYNLKGKMDPHDISPTWNDEVMRAEDTLLDKLQADIEAAVKMVEAQLHDGAFSRR